MKVGYVLRWFPARSETFIAREIDAMLALGVEVDVVSLGTRRDGHDGLGVAASVFDAPRGVHRLRWLRHLRPGDGRLLSLQRPKDALRLPWLRRMAQQRGWTGLHVHFAGEALEVALGARTGLPVTVTAHASDLFRPRPGLGERLRQCARVVTVCEHHRGWIARHHGVDAEVVRCGIDPDGYAPARQEPGPLRVICVARDVPKKNLDQLVRCLPDDATLRLVSDGVRLRGDRVHVGPLRPSEVPAALQRAHVFALPCQVAPDGDRDGVPVALMEAMASRLPVITTQVSGIPELVDGRVGWCIPPRDDAALRSAFAAARSVDERRSRGRRGQQRVAAEWTVLGGAERLLAVLASVAD